MKVRGPCAGVESAHLHLSLFSPSSGPTASWQEGYHHPEDSQILPPYALIPRDSRSLETPANSRKNPSRQQSESDSRAAQNKQRYLWSLSSRPALSAFPALRPYSAFEAREGKGLARGLRSWRQLGRVPGHQPESSQSCSPIYRRKTYRPSQPQASPNQDAVHRTCTCGWAAAGAIHSVQRRKAVTVGPDLQPLRLDALASGLSLILEVWTPPP